LSSRPPRSPDGTAPFAGAGAPSARSGGGQATKSLMAGITVLGASSISQWLAPVTTWPRTSDATSSACSMRKVWHERAPHVPRLGVAGQQDHRAALPADEIAEPQTVDLGEALGEACGPGRGPLGSGHSLILRISSPRSRTRRRIWLVWSLSSRTRSDFMVAPTADVATLVATTYPRGLRASTETSRAVPASVVLRLRTAPLGPPLGSDRARESTPRPKVTLLSVAQRAGLLPFFTLLHGPAPFLASRYRRLRYRCAMLGSGGRSA
jgi:hypothetical protein